MGGRRRRRRAGLPEGVREVVTRRLARLPDAARRILAVAAVMGPEFELRPLAAVVELDEVVVLDALEAGVTAQVILEAPEAVDRYVFSHASSAARCSRR